MEFLYSNFPPMKTGCKTFLQAFTDLTPKCTSMDIAVGYVTTDSLAELQKLVEFNDNLHKVNLTIGMHYFDHFTKPEYMAALGLNKFLQQEHRGEVRLVNTFRYHGKLYSYSNAGGPFAGIIGSNNLSSIVDGGTRVYESSVLLDDRPSAVKIHKFIQDLVVKATKNISELSIKQFNTNNKLLQNQIGVEKASIAEQADCRANLTGVRFEIPLKDAPKSNLNAYFGKGREGKNGLVKPRPWYEVELIVPKEITMRPEYPKAGTDSAEFTVITDDGWKFKCKVSGDYNKNFRSAEDLKILGKWIKGRLEEDGALKTAQMVTEKVLSQYGRHTVTFAQTKRKGLWYLDFSKR